MPKSVRKNRSKKARFEIFKRDRFTCSYCGRTPPAVLLVLDHVVPIAEGGSNDEDNLVAACQECNQGKGARPLDSLPEPMAERARAAAEKREQIEAYNAMLMAEREAMEQDVDAVGRHWFDYFNHGYVFAGQRKSTVRNYLKQLPRAVILEAVDIAMERYPLVESSPDATQLRTFKYFCGICKNRIRGFDPFEDRG